MWSLALPGLSTPSTSRNSSGLSTAESDVTVSAADLERLAAGRSPEAFVRACFEFLLEREPKESILRAFDVGEIGTYFPGFEGEISRRP